MDDGPRDEAGSLALATLAFESGTTTLVATPHRNRRYQPSQAAIGEAADRLRERLSSAGVALEIRTGAELALEQAAALPDEELADLRLGGGPWLLLESPYEAVGPELERVVQRLLSRGHRVLLAHPERSPALRDRPRRLAALVELGVRCSITAASLEGRFGQAAQWSALELLRSGLAHSIDSDAHDALRRPPGLQPGVNAALSRLPALAAVVERLTTGAAAAILSGAPLPGED